MFYFATLPVAGSLVLVGLLAALRGGMDETIGWLGAGVVSTALVVTAWRAWLIDVVVLDDGAISVRNLWRSHVMPAADVDHVEFRSPAWSYPSEYLVLKDGTVIQVQGLPPARANELESELR